MKKYPMERQSELKDCGVSCLLMIIRYYKGYIPKDQLLEMTKTNKDGTTAYHLVKTLEEVGFNAYGVKCKFSDFEISPINFPCIASVTIDKSYKHFVVIYDINVKRKYLVIGDPARKITKIPFSEFEAIYNEVLILAEPIKTIPLIADKDYSFLWKIISNQKKLIKKLIYLSLLLTSFSVIGSLYMECMLKGLKTNTNNYLMIIFIIFFSINILKILLSFIRNKILIYINQRIDLPLTLDVFKKILNLPYRYYRNRTTGDILSRINDLSLIRDVISRVSLSLFIDLPLTVLTIFILFSINKLLFHVVICMVILYVSIMLVFKHYYTSEVRKTQKSKAESNSYMVETISGFETIKGIHLEKESFIKFRKKYYDFLNNVFNYQKLYFRHHFLNDLISELGSMIIILIGCMLINSHQLTLGNLLTFNVLLTCFFEPIINTSDLYNNINESHSSLKRVMEIMNKESDHGVLDIELKGNIDFQNLTYSFNDRNNVLKNINLNINLGNKVMIVGKSGSGKSTLLKLLMKYYPVNQQTVMIDGVDINSISSSAISRGIVYINQNEILFSDTLYNNINMDNKDNDRFLGVTKMCYIDEIISNDLGYRMIIEENGFNLSGGEKQRIVLARTLLRPFQILIIDEGLNQIDISLERKILKNIFKNFPNKTIIVISHRLDNMDLFDHFIEMKQGKIVRNVRKQGI